MWGKWSQTPQQPLWTTFSKYGTLQNQSIILLAPDSTVDAL